MVNLEWYRTFKAVYQNGTLTKAAQELLISQPNVSIQIAALESYMGHPLFTRLPRKMLPTELGKQLYTQIVESIDTLEKVETQFKKSVINKIPLIRFGSPHEFFLNYLAKNIDGLDFQLDVSLGLAKDLISMLHNSFLDVAIITNKDKDDTSLTYEPLLTENILVIANANFDSSELDDYIKEDDIHNIHNWLKEQMWIAYDNNLSMIRRFWRENFNKRPILKLKSTIPDNNAILSAVANSNVLCVSSNLIAGKDLNENKIKILWKGMSKTTNDLYLAYDNKKVDPKMVSLLKDYILNNTIPFIK